MAGIGISMVIGDRGRGGAHPGLGPEGGGLIAANLRGSATGLVERAAAAYVSAVPHGDVDDGLFGPGSVTRRVSTDLAAPVAGLRSLLMQTLRPLAMAGVDRHGGWRRDPIGRLAATSAFLAALQRVTLRMRAARSA